MVNAVSSAPYYSYLNQLQGVNDTATTPAPTATTTSTPSTDTTSSASSSLDSLVGSGGLSAAILDLLQGGGQGSFNSSATLLGGTTNNDPTAGLFASLLSNSSLASAQSVLDEITQQNQEAQATTSPVQDLITSSSTASTAYNTTLEQNAQSVINANSFEADGVTPLVV